MNHINLPEIMPADVTLHRIRKYKPEDVVRLINSEIESFINAITDIRNAKKKFNITEYISGYSLSDIKSLVKKLFKEYNSKGYIIKYSVYYHREIYRTPEYRLKIKHIRFNKPETKSKLRTQDAPPSYSETEKKNTDGIKRFACGLL